MDIKQLRTRAVIGLLAAGTVFGGMAGAASAAPNKPKPIDTDQNHVSYWEDQGYGDCFKVEDPADPFVVPAPDAGMHWTVLIIKAGSASSLPADQVNQVIPNPVEGQSYTHVSGKGISHIILCEDGGSTYPPS